MYQPWTKSGRWALYGQISLSERQTKTSETNGYRLISQLQFWWRKSPFLIEVVCVCDRMMTTMAIVIPAIMIISVFTDGTSYYYGKQWFPRKKKTKSLFFIIIGGQSSGLVPVIKITQWVDQNHDQNHGSTVILLVHQLTHQLNLRQARSYQWLVSWSRSYGHPSSWLCLS